MVVGQLNFSGFGLNVDKADAVVPGCIYRLYHRRPHCLEGHVNCLKPELETCSQLKTRGIKSQSSFFRRETDCQICLATIARLLYHCNHCNHCNHCRDCKPQVLCSGLSKLEWLLEPTWAVRRPGVSEFSEGRIEFFGLVLSGPFEGQR